ncbi:MAG: hypothetical protein R2852_03980 [Bacteroidia bacterium]
MLEVWKDEELDSLLKNAGSEYLEEASRYKYNSTQILLTSRELVLLEHKDLLLENNNMAPEFVEEFQTLRTDLEAMYEKYLDTTNQSQFSTNYVLEAMNKLYSDLMTMFADAKLVPRINGSLKAFCV